MQMSASQPTSRQGPTADTPRTERADAPSEAMTTLRGSSVGKVDTHRVGQVILVLTLVTLLVLAIVFLVAGIHRNNQVSTLRNQGVPAVMTVTRCAVLLGGSGSTAAGASCRGTFTLNGHQYSEAIPGSAQYDTGHQLHIIVVPNDPALLAPAHVAANEHSSWTTFILPVILFVAFLLLLGWFVLQRRHRSQGSG